MISSTLHLIPPTFFHYICRACVRIESTVSDRATIAVLSQEPSNRFGGHVDDMGIIGAPGVEPRHTAAVEIGRSQNREHIIDVRDPAVCGNAVCHARRKGERSPLATMPNR